MYLFIKNKRVSGCVVVERIESAFKLISGEKKEEKKSVEEEEDSVSLSKENALPGNEERSANEETIICSKEKYAAKCGISRIWVSSSERRKGIATKLMDCVRANLIYGYSIGKEECAFTQPTFFGKKFAEKYFENPNFLVYK